MPIEIRELVIKVTVDESTPDKMGAVPASPGSNDREGIIEDCVDQVMQILRDQAER